MRGVGKISQNLATSMKNVFCKNCIIKGGRSYGKITILQYQMIGTGN
jgi:hypothetical protein